MILQILTKKHFFYRETTKVIADVPAGNLQIEFTGLDANGNVLSSRITHVTLAPGQTLPVSVILGVSILSDGFFPSTITLYKGDYNNALNAGGGIYDNNNPAKINNPPAPWTYGTGNNLPQNFSSII